MLKRIKVGITLHLVSMLFQIVSYASYADDNNPYTCRNKPHLEVEKFKDDSNIIFKWVSDNALKANPDKFHLLLNSNDDEIYNILIIIGYIIVHMKNFWVYIYIYIYIYIDIDNRRIYNSPHEKLLGIYIYIYIYIY